MLLIIKDINIKTLVSGDKSARIILETTSPGQVTELAILSKEVELDVKFKKGRKKESPR